MNLVTAIEGAQEAVCHNLNGRDMVISDSFVDGPQVLGIGVMKTTGGEIIRVRFFSSPGAVFITPIPSTTEGLVAGPRVAGPRVDPRVVRILDWANRMSHPARWRMRAYLLCGGRDVDSEDIAVLHHTRAVIAQLIGMRRSARVARNHAEQAQLLAHNSLGGRIQRAEIPTGLLQGRMLGRSWC